MEADWEFYLKSLITSIYLSQVTLHSSLLEKFSVTVESYQAEILAKAGKVREVSLFIRAKQHEAGQLLDGKKVLESNISSRRDMLKKILTDFQHRNGYPDFSPYINKIVSLFDAERQIKEIDVEITKKNKIIDEHIDAKVILSNELIDLICNTNIENVDIQKETIGKGNTDA